MEKDELVFTEDSPAEPQIFQFWKILVVDDSEEVHHATNYALTSRVMHGRKFETLHAYNGKEACDILEKSADDIHLVLLDCIMENNHAGFDVAKYLKQTLRKNIPVIVMRSGFAGSFGGVESILNDHPEVDAYIEKASGNNSNTMLSALELWLSKQI